jgi:hypothetical protein
VTRRDVLALAEALKGTRPDTLPPPLHPSTYTKVDAKLDGRRAQWEADVRAMADSLDRYHALVRGSRAEFLAACGLDNAEISPTHAVSILKRRTRAWKP